MVDGGQVAFADGRLEVTIDCVWLNACVAGKDLAFTASLNGSPAVDDGKLTITGSRIDFDLDDADAVICAVASALMGPFGVLLYAAVLGGLASWNPNSSRLDDPVSETSQPLPGSDKVLDVKLKRP